MEENNNLAPLINITKDLVIVDKQRVACAVNNCKAGANPKNKVVEVLKRIPTAVQVYLCNDCYKRYLEARTEWALDNE